MLGLSYLRKIKRRKKINKMSEPIICKILFQILINLGEEICKKIKIKKRSNYKRTNNKFKMDKTNNKTNKINKKMKMKSKSTMTMILTKKIKIVKV